MLAVLSSSMALPGCADLYLDNSTPRESTQLALSTALNKLVGKNISEAYEILGEPSYIYKKSSGADYFWKDDFVDKVSFLEMDNVGLATGGAYINTTNPVSATCTVIATTNSTSSIEFWTLNTGKSRCSGLIKKLPR